jgi:SAM-dependent methyltransferase
VSAPMADAVYEVIDGFETYWRNVARQELLLRLWRRHSGVGTRVLDVGCGVGTLLAFLGRRTTLQGFGVDLYPEALRYCRRRGVSTVAAADALALPFRDGAFDLVVCQDVVEHVRDDAVTLAELRRVTAPDGLVLIVAPAFGGLWSARDVRLGHHRRYRLEGLSERMTAAGFEIVHGTYTDSWLFPLLAGAILLAKRTPEGLADLRDDAAPGGRGLPNRILLAVSRLEAAWTVRWRLPFGVAAVAAGRPRRRAGARTKDA